MNEIDAKLSTYIPNYLEHLTMMAAKIAAPLLAQTPTPKTPDEFESALDAVANVSVNLARRILAKAAE